MRLKTVSLAFVSVSLPFVSVLLHYISMVGLAIQSSFKVGLSKGMRFMQRPLSYKHLLGSNWVPEVTKQP